MQDIWILDHTLAKWMDFLNIEVTDDLKICIFLNDANQWVQEILNQHFSEILAQCVAAISTNYGGGTDSPKLV